MKRAIVLALVLAVVASCDAGVELEPLPTNPPYGLTKITMPNTEAEVIAAVQAMPAEIHGRKRAGPGHVGASYGEVGIMWAIQGLPARDVGGSPVEWVVQQAGMEQSGVLDERALSVDGELVWFTAEQEWVEPDLPAEHSGTVYVMLWAVPDGAWSFWVQATTPEGRAALVREFVLAAAGG